MAMHRQVAAAKGNLYISLPELRKRADEVFAAARKLGRTVPTWDPSRTKMTYFDVNNGTSGGSTVAEFAAAGKWTRVTLTLSRWSDQPFEEPRSDLDEAALAAIPGLARVVDALVGDCRLVSPPSEPNVAF